MKHAEGCALINAEGLFFVGHMVSDSVRTD